MMESGGLSAADIMAITRDSAGQGGNNGGFGSDMWNNPFIYLVWMALFGGRWGGFGGNQGDSGSGSGGSMTRADLWDGFSNNQILNGLSGITNGLCDGFYAINNAIKDCCCESQFAANQGFNNLEKSIMGVGYALRDGFCGTEKTIMGSDFHNQAGFNSLANQLAQCCCDLRYEAASHNGELKNLIQCAARDIIDSNNNGVRSIIDFLFQDKYQTLRAENEDLRRAASQDRQSALFTTALERHTDRLLSAISPTPQPAYVVPNPNTWYGGYGYGSGCGSSCSSCC